MRCRIVRVVLLPVLGIRIGGEAADARERVIDVAARGRRRISAASPDSAAAMPTSCVRQSR